MKSKIEIQPLKSGDRLQLAEQITFQMTHDHIDKAAAAKSLMDGLKGADSETIGLNLPKQLLGADVDWDKGTAKAGAVAPKATPVVEDEPVVAANVIQDTKKKAKKR
jgi:hypothetical protein